MLSLVIRNFHSSGTLGFGLGRTAEIVCGVRKDDGSYERMIYEFGPSDMGWEKEVRARCALPYSPTAQLCCVVVSMVTVI